MARVLISLLGGRPLPNILVALYFSPDYYRIIVSRDSIGIGGNYEKAIKALPEKLRPPAPPLAVSPYSRQETFDKCKEIVQQYQEDQEAEIIIAAASEPKMMTLGAYDFAKARNFQMVYVARDGLVWILPEESEPKALKIGLKQYFQAYGWDVKLKGDNVREKFKRLTSLLASNLPISHFLLHRLRSAGQRKGRRTVRVRGVRDEEFELLREIEAIGVVSNVRKEDNTTIVTINSQEDGEFLLTGDWLEYYTYTVAKRISNDRGLLFEECAWGVEDKAGKGELDFAGIFGGQLVIASCKTENGIKRTWFEELHSKAEQLGKGMCSTLLVSSVPQKSRTEANLEKYRKWAKERQIVLVMAEDLPQLPKILEKIAMGRRDAEPKHIPYYPRI